MVFNLKIQLDTGRVSMKLEFGVFLFIPRSNTSVHCEIQAWNVSILYYIFVQFRIISVSNFDKIAVEDWIDTKLDLR